MRGIFDRRKAFALAALLILSLVGTAEAQVIGKAMSAGALPACNSAVQYGVVYDATNGTTLGSGGGTAWVHVSCATGSWAIEQVADVTDLGAYLPVSGTTAAPIVIQGSGAGNDASVIAADDIFITPADALVAVAGGNTTITSTAGTVAIASSAGAVTVTAVGATNDVTVAAADDVILSPTDALTVTGTSATVNAGGSTVELTVAAGVFKVGVAVVFPAAGTLPTCDTTLAPAGFYAMYVDTTGPDLCLCTGSAWVTVDGSGTCV